MKRAFWIGGLVGLVMPFLIYFPDQIIPTRLWFVLEPAALAASTLWDVLHMGSPAPLPTWEKILCQIVAFGGNFLIYGLLACAIWRFRSPRPVAED
jgi:hypothetical protein